MSSRRQDRKGKVAKEGTSSLPAKDFQMPGHRKTNPNPKATATSTSGKGKQDIPISLRTTTAAKAKGREKKNVNKRELNEYEVCKMYGWKSVMDWDPATFIKPDPEPVAKKDKEPWKRILAWDKESIEELERKEGEEEADWVYNEEKMLEFDKRMAKHSNWTDEDWEYANLRRKNCKEFWEDLDFDTYWSGLCHNPECLGLSSDEDDKPDRPGPQYRDGVLVIEDECSDMEYGLYPPSSPPNEPQFLS